jgi:periplasmic divalent cation tolerance protein
MKYHLLVYVICKNTKQAKQIAKVLLSKNLCACVNIIQNIQSLCFWPTKDKISSSKETLMLVKTMREKYTKLEKEIIKLHTYKTPCIIAIPIVFGYSEYLNWLSQTIKK